MPRLRWPGTPGTGSRSESLLSGAAGSPPTRSHMPDYGAFVPAQRLRQSLALSPDGSMLAYASDASGQFNVWVQPAAGGQARQLTFLTKGSVRQLAWAPDASRIVFKADECGDEQTQIYLVSVDGDKPLMLSSGVRQHRVAEKTPLDPSGRYLL